MDRGEEWRIFVEVASRKSFAAAARQLGKSPQAVTRAIAALETRVGTRLLHRTTRAVSLSSDGERLLARARAAVAELDALEQPAGHAALTGTLSITAPVVFGQLHVLPVVQAFLAAHAGVTVRLVLLDRIVALAEEGIDVAVRIGALPDSALRARSVGQVRSVLVASPRYLDEHGTPRSLEALPSHACIAFAGTTPVPDRWTFGARTIAIAPRLIVNTAQAAIDAAVAGGGIARVLSYQIEALVAAGTLRRLLVRSEPAAVPVQLVTLPGVQSRLAVAFSELAGTQLRARLART
jgi:DNA-binding transcriptional LysR family regulator